VSTAVVLSADDVESSIRWWIILLAVLAGLLLLLLLILLMWKVRFILPHHIPLLIVFIAL